MAQLNKSVYFHHLSVCLFECYALHQTPLLVVFNPEYCIVLKTTSKRFCMASIYVYKQNLGGQNNYFEGTKSVWSPQTEFEGTKE